MNKGLRLAVSKAIQQGESGVLLLHADLPLLKGPIIDRVIQQAMARARATLAEARQAIGDQRASAQAGVHTAEPGFDLAQSLRDESERLRAVGIACGTRPRRSRVRPFLITAD